MDYEIRWRAEDDLRWRLKSVKGPYSFKWLIFEPTYKLRLFGCHNESAWICSVRSKTGITSEEREAIENFAKARYGL